MANPGVNMESVWGLTRQYIVSNRTNPSPRSYVADLSDAGLNPNDKTWLIGKCRSFAGAQTPHAKQVVAHVIQEIQTYIPLPAEKP